MNEAADIAGCIAYIDGANLHKGVQSSGWNMDYKNFTTGFLPSTGQSV